MATPLDTTLLENFAPVFAFLFVFIVIFGILSYINFMGGNKGVAALIAIILAIMSLFSKTVIETVITMAPWFILFFIFIIFILITVMIFGAKETDIFSFLKNKEHGFVAGWITVILILIFFGSFFSVISKHKAEQNETITSIEDVAPKDSFLWVIFHPKVLGAIITLLVGLFAIQKLASKT